MSHDIDDVKSLVRVRIVRLSARVTGTVCGLIGGFGLFLATNYLIIKGGRVVGPHLALLGQVFPGYRVTFVGSLIGLAYAFFTCWILGFAGALLYNAIASRK
jgi:hypothetical protein